MSSPRGITAAEARAEAALLDDAERARAQIRQTTAVYPDMTMDDAYSVQAAWQSLMLTRGERVVGHKIGLTSRAMQQSMNITTPDSGFLTDRMMYEAGAEISAGAFLDGRLEVELAFILGHDLKSADVTIDAVLDATEYVTPAVELIAARTFRTDPATGRTRTVIDTIADNAACGAVVLGGKAIAPRSVDLRWVGALAYRNDSLEESGLAAAVLNHPANGIVWLVRRYVELGMILEAGQIVLAGSFTRPIPIAAGDRFAFDFGPHGDFAVTFAP
jgi:2-oxo-hept-3-ene-1,7-dioate hydratase